MSAEGEHVDGPSSAAESQSEEIRDEWIPLLERYEATLQQGGSIPPEEWLRAHAEIPHEALRWLEEVYWLYGEGRRPAAGAAPASLPLPNIPGYKILEVLGRGGMAVVYKAEQLRPKRLVALKMILGAVAPNEEQPRRFENEPEALARLCHPNVVQVYEVSQHEGQHFFSMELMEGGNLAQRLAGRLQPPREAASLIATLARAVDLAHQQGIIHRDLKPANILLTAQGVPKISDFGLAKWIDADECVTRTGVVVGTPSYMAPEQANAKHSEVGPRADVYALGAILYDMLVGRPPFKSASVLDTLDQVRSQEPTRPSELVPKLPRDLETICLKCLEKEPGRRYASALSLAEDLERFLAGRPIQARPVSRVKRFGRWYRRHLPMAVSLTAVMVLLVLVAVGSTVVALHIAAARRAEAEARERAEQNFTFALQAVDRYYTEVSENQELRAHGLEGLRKNLLEAAQHFYKQFVAERAGDARLRAELARTHFRLASITSAIGSAAEAIQLYEQARLLFEQLVREDPTNVGLQGSQAQVEYRLGALYQSTGRTKEAETAFRKSVEMGKRLVQDAPDVADFRRTLARAYRSLGSLYAQKTTGRDRAEESLQSALSIYERLRTEHPADISFQQELSLTHHSLGRLYGLLYSLAEEGRLSSYQLKAVEAFRQALEIQENLVREHPAVPDLRRSLADSYFSVGYCWYHNFHLGGQTKSTEQMQQAEAAFQKALPLLEKLARDHPLVHVYQDKLARTSCLLALVAEATNRREQAEQLLRQALPIQEKLAREHPTVTDYARSLAVTCQKLATLVEDPTQAQTKLDWYTQSVCALEAWYKQDPHSVLAKQFLGIMHGHRGSVLAQIGRHEEAIWEWEKAIYYNIDGWPGTGRLRARQLLSRVHVDGHARATEEARALAEKGAKDLPTINDLIGVYSAAAEAALKDVQLDSTGQQKRAEQYAQQAIDLLTKADADGMFTDPKELATLKSGADFSYLRMRADFKALLKTIEEKGKPGQ